VRLLRLLPLVVLVALVAAPPVSAAERERGWISVGWFLTDVSTEVEAHVDGHPDGTLIDFEDTLGLSDSTDEFALEGYFRFRQHQRIFFDYLSFSRDRTATLSQDIAYEDVTLFAGTQATAEFDFLAAQLGWRFDVVDTERFELGLSVGVTYMDLTAKLSGEGSYDDGSGPKPFAGSRSSGVSAPVPLVGAHFDWDWDERFFVRLCVQYMGASLDDFDGSMLRADARFDWMFSQHVGIGAGYSYTDISLDDIEGQDLSGSVDYRYSGVYGYLSFRF